MYVYETKRFLRFLRLLTNNVHHHHSCNWNRSKLANYSRGWQASTTHQTRVISKDRRVANGAGGAAVSVAITSAVRMWETLGSDLASGRCTWQLFAWLTILFFLSLSGYSYLLPFSLSPHIVQWPQGWSISCRSCPAVRRVLMDSQSIPSHSQGYSFSVCPWFTPAFHVPLRLLWKERHVQTTSALVWWCGEAVQGGDYTYIHLSYQI